MNGAVTALAKRDRVGRPARKPRASACPVQKTENRLHKILDTTEIACYSPSFDLVRVPELFRYEKAEEYYSTFFHELAHATGHESRLNREGVTGQHFFGDAVYSREELVAEMTAAFLCGYTGIENATIQNSAAYLHSWIRTLRGDRKLAIIAAAQAQKAADYILNRKSNDDA